MGFVLIFIWWVMTCFWWLFAFWRIPNAPEWLTKAQIVCFGSNPNGLPETYGWIMLIGGPSLILITMSVIWMSELKELFMKTKQNQLTKKMLVFMAIVSLGLILWVNQQLRAGFLFDKQSEPALLQELPDNYPVLNKSIPAFSLVDEWGQTVTPEKIKGRVALISFMFAHCQTMCPAIVDQVKFALKKLNRTDIPVYFITLDPWRDTPASLPALSKKWGNHPQLHFLSGDPKSVSAVIESFGVPAQRDMKSGDIAHPAMSFVINAEGTIQYALNNASGSLIADAIKKTLK